MKRASLAVVLSLFAAACGSSTTAPTTPANPTFTAQLLPSNEAPSPITNAESVASGSATITFVTTKDASGAVTSAVGTAVVNLQGFPAGSSITLAHIHTGAAGVAGGVFVAFIPSGTVTLTNGAGTFTQTNNLTGDQATSIMNNPAGYLLQRAHGAESGRRDARTVGENSITVIGHQSPVDLTIHPVSLLVSRTLLLGTALLACLSGACGSSTAAPSPSASGGPFADLSGTWTGTFESANFSTRAITLTVVQTGNCVDGAWISSTSDWHGAISGLATADSFSGFLSFERAASAGGACDATAPVSGAAGQTLRFAADRLGAVGSCDGDLPKQITVTLHR